MQVVVLYGCHLIYLSLVKHTLQRGYSNDYAPYTPIA